MNPNGPASTTPPILATAPRRSPLVWVVMGGLVLAVVVLGVLAVSAYRTSQRDRQNLDSASAQAKQAGYKQGQTDQQATGAKAAESPFRSYLAPTIYGGIKVSFPKTWSATVKEDQSNQTQIDLTANPDFVQIHPNTNDDLDALHFSLIQRLYTDELKQYQDEAKNNHLTLSSATAAGISGTEVDGKFDNVHDGILVLVPVRDKTAVFSTDSRNFSSDFQLILHQSAIAP